MQSAAVDTFVWPPQEGAPNFQVQGEGNFRVEREGQAPLEIPAGRIIGWVSSDEKWEEFPRDGRPDRVPVYQKLQPHLVGDSIVLAMFSETLAGGTLVAHASEGALAFKLLAEGAAQEIGTVGLDDHFKESSRPSDLEIRARALAQVYHVRLEQDPFQVHFEPRHVTFTLQCWNPQLINYEVGLFTKVRELKARCGDPEALYFYGFSLRDDRLLVEYGMKEGSEFEVGEGGDGDKALGLLQFARLDRPILDDYNPDAPPWKQVAKGLNLLGTCPNVDSCGAKGGNAWAHLGFTSFEFPDCHELAKCAGCDTALVRIETCALLDCVYSITGHIEGEPHPTKYPEATALADQVTKFDAQRKADWRHLNMRVQPNN